jgi:hypothetical protein
MSQRTASVPSPRKPRGSGSGEAKSRGTARPERPGTTWGGVERLLEDWHKRMAGAEAAHFRWADRYGKRHVVLGLIVVGITGFIGSSVFTSLQDRGVSTAARLLVGSISVIAALLASVQTFLKYAERAEKHRVAAVRYGALRRRIAGTLNLPVNLRSPPEGVIQDLQEAMEKAALETPRIGERPWKRVKRALGIRAREPLPKEREDSRRHAWRFRSRPRP